MLKPRLLTGFGKINFGKQYRQGNRVYDSKEIAMCLNASPIGNMGGYSYLYVVKNNNKNQKEKNMGGIQNNKKDILS